MMMVEVMLFFGELLAIHGYFGVVDMVVMLGDHLPGRVRGRNSQVLRNRWLVVSEGHGHWLWSLLRVILIKHGVLWFWLILEA